MSGTSIIAQIFVPLTDSNIGTCQREGKLILDNSTYRTIGKETF